MSTNSYIVSRNCPSCDSSPESSTTHCSAKIQAEKLSNEELKEYFIGFREEQCFFTYNRCNFCGQLYCPKYFSQEALNELYSFMPDNTSVSGERDSERTQLGYVKFFPLGKRNQTYLEIGADIGLLAAQIKKTFKITDIDAVEPNLGVHDDLNEKLEYQVSIFTESSQLPKKKIYDKIAAIHVVDHLLEPKLELSIISEHMDEQSHLLIVIHNEKTVLRKLLKQKWPPFCLQHPELYNKSTIKNMLSKSGLETLKISRTSNYIGLNHGISLLQSIGMFPKQKRPALPNISFPLRLGNIAVIAKKQ